MIRRAIGRNGPTVNAIGLGCMGMAAFYGAPMEEADAVKLLHTAVDLGVDHFDTAEMYGLGLNERQLGAAFHDRRDKVFIATKFGPKVDPVTQQRLGVDGSAENAKRALENSLRFLRTDHVDLWFAALQSEFSIFTRVVEDEGILAATKETGTTLVAYSPLGRGMLTGWSKDWKPNGWDFRATMAPRFSGEALENNLALVEEIARIASSVGATAGQVALAWVLARDPDVVVIPGTTKVANLKTNVGAADIKLSADMMARLNGLAAKVKGERYDEAGMTSVRG
jgi:aryl-alcohol dehydrogenase-like predicted oxidoreductase